VQASGRFGIFDAMGVSLVSERGSRLKRTLDAWLGRHLVLALALFRPRRKQPVVVEHIGILMLAAIGDSILASAIVHDLRRTFPAARTTAFVSGANRGILDLLDGFDQVVEVPIGRPIAALALIRRFPLDLMIDIGQWARASALLAGLSRARFTVGFKTAGKHRHWAFDAAVEHSRARHEIDNFRALAVALGVESAALPRLRPRVLAGIASPLARPYVVIHPWASGYRSELREWRIENWIAVAGFIIDSGYTVVITGGPADGARANALAARVQRPAAVAVLAGRSNLCEAAAALAQAAAVVSVNTGTMHLAALLDRPMLALHGPTNPKRWGPLSTRSVIIGPGPEQGGAYLNLGFEYPSSPIDCMAKITPAEVIERLRELLLSSASIEDTSQ
jgi:heptosyltransferase-3